MITGDPFCKRKVLEHLDFSIYSESGERRSNVGLHTYLLSLASRPLFSQLQMRYQLGLKWCLECMRVVAIFFKCSFLRAASDSFDASSAAVCSAAQVRAIARIDPALGFLNNAEISLKKAEVSLQIAQVRYFS